MGDGEQLRVGIIGAGHNTTSRHIPGLQAIDGVTITMVCNRSRASSERVAAGFGIAGVAERWTDVAAAPDVDAVVIGTWPYLHARATIAALHAGKHVLCEARMAATAAEARAMRDAARARPQLVAQVVPAPHSLPFDATIRRLVAERYLGDLLAVDVRVGGEFVDPDAPLHWRQDADLSGVNVLSLGIWYEQLLRWVGEATRVTAMGMTYVRMRVDDRGVARAVRVPEHVDVVAELACGAQAHLQISAVTGLSGGPEAWLFGSAGTLRLAHGALWGGRRGDAELAEIPVPAHERGGWRVEEEFVAAIRGQEPVTHTSFEDGVKYMDFTQAVADSIAGGRTVALPL